MVYDLSGSYLVCYLRAFLARSSPRHHQRLSVLLPWRSGALTVSKIIHTTGTIIRRPEEDH